MPKQKKQLCTSKKVKVIGTMPFINAVTGEVEDFQVNSIEERDFNFTKIWMRNLIATLELVGNQKTKLAYWIIEHLDRENKLTLTLRQIAEQTGISLETVRITIKILLDADFLRKINISAYMVNPEVIFKGKSLCCNPNTAYRYQSRRPTSRTRIQEDPSLLPKLKTPAKDAF